MISEVVGFLSPMWETWIEFLTPDFRPVPTLTIAGIWVMNQRMGALSDSEFLLLKEMWFFVVVFGLI